METEINKSINVRFSDDEWLLIEKARKNFGVKTRGNLLRFLLVPVLRKMEVQTQ
jgi:hypothetical protein